MSARIWRRGRCRPTTDDAVVATYWMAPSPGPKRGDLAATVPHQALTAAGTGPDAAHRMGATTIKLSAVPLPESTMFLTRLRTARQFSRLPRARLCGHLWARLKARAADRWWCQNWLCRRRDGTTGPV